MIVPRKVYAIQHNVTQRIYIGSSGKLQDRIASHLYALRTGKHPVEDMQADYDKYGEDYSIWELDEIKSYEEAKKEYEWMDKYNSRTKGVGYNYKDHTAQRKEQKELIECRKEITSIVNRLNAEQCIFVLTFLKRLF